MRTLLPVLVAALLVGCGGNDTTTTDLDTQVPDTLNQVPVDQPWTGHYEDTLPCADCEGILTQLWVRSDSTFVRQMGYLGRDSSAYGTIGSWKVANGVLSLACPGNKTDRYRSEEARLRMVDDAGKPFGSAHPYTLERIVDEGQVIPRMRLTGTFTYMADAMSFKPCGATRSWPCAGGEEWTDEGEKGGSLNTVELERHYLRSVKQGGDPWTIEVECTMAMGPAMEGDGKDEYIFIHRVLRAVEACL